MNPALFTPCLLGTSSSVSLGSLEELAGVLEPRYAIRDLDLVRQGVERPTRIRYDVSSLTVGRVGLTSVLGPPLGLAVDPLQPCCTLALPSHGCGVYSIRDERIANIAGQSAAFLPAGGWRLVNDHTGGTALHFSEDDLIRCIQAMGRHRYPRDDSDATALRQRLALPFVISTDAPPFSQLYQQLLTVMGMVHDLGRRGIREPDPMLCLDDLILRSVALLLLPAFGRGRLSPWQPDGPPRDSHGAVSLVMEWMLANLHRPISLSEIEKQASYGRRALQAGFKACVGCGPMQWLRRQRLDLARQRLQAAAPGVTVTQVSQSCGYLNLASFSRDFSERFGVGPRQLLLEARSRHQLSGADGALC